MKRDKFVSLAESRTRNAIKQIQLIGNLSNRSSYDFNDQDIDSIFSALFSEIKKSRSKFEPSNHSGAESSFSLVS